MAGLDVTTRTDDGVGDALSLSLTFDSSLYVIELFGELDLAGAPKLEQAIARAEETSAATILVDLSALEFIDLRGIRVLVAESRRSSSGTDRLRFLRGAAVERILALSGLDARLPFLD